MAKLFNLARMTTATTGTGTITLGSAVSGFLTFAQAGVSNGDVVSYSIRDGSASEQGTGTYTSSGTTLTRTVIKSTNSDTAINLSGTAQVFITPNAADIERSSFIASGRLSLVSGTAVPTTDQTAKTTLYYALYNGDRIDLYNGAGHWSSIVFTELSLALGTLTSGKNYDVFIYNNAGTATMELSAAWTNDTTRADALTTQNGILVKSGATTRRYVGTIRTTATTTTEDSKSQRFVWNMYNRVPRFMSVVDTTDTWTYAVTAWQAARGQAANKVDYVCGDSDVLIVAHVRYSAEMGGGVAGSMGIGIDTAAANSAQFLQELLSLGNGWGGADYFGYPGLGYHYIQWIEYRRAGTITFHGDNGVADEQSGLMAIVNG